MNCIFMRVFIAFGTLFYSTFRTQFSRKPTSRTSYFKFYSDAILKTSNDNIKGNEWQSVGRFSNVSMFLGGVLKACHVGNWACDPGPAMDVRYPLGEGTLPNMSVYLPFCQSYFGKAYLSYFMKLYLSLSTTKYAYKNVFHFLTFAHKCIFLKYLGNLNTCLFHHTSGYNK